eukprot:TRINITY_DN3939_c0_g1_i2.p1 TRINITY_DN3939_c0_g1~~TRINITY_DN3939_c0_g1_i2.p1  ORF type:complete len:1097 (-),score=195.72 TRINITY_DN3939_c0_g1_i2:87-3377(-)
MKIKVKRPVSLSFILIIIVAIILVCLPPSASGATQRPVNVYCDDALCSQSRTPVYFLLGEKTCMFINNMCGASRILTMNYINATHTEFIFYEDEPCTITASKFINRCETGPNSCQAYFYNSTSLSIKVPSCDEIMTSSLSYASSTSLRSTTMANSVSTSTSARSTSTSNYVATSLATSTSANFASTSQRMTTTAYNNYITTSQRSASTSRVASSTTSNNGLYIVTSNLAASSNNAVSSSTTAAYGITTTTAAAAGATSTTSTTTTMGSETQRTLNIFCSNTTCGGERFETPKVSRLSCKEVSFCGFSFYTNVRFVDDRNTTLDFYGETDNYCQGPFETIHARCGAGGTCSLIESVRGYGASMTIPSCFADMTTTAAAAAYMTSSTAAANNAQTTIASSSNPMSSSLSTSLSSTTTTSSSTTSTSLLASSTGTATASLSSSSSSSLWLTSSSSVMDSGTTSISSTSTPSSLASSSSSSSPSILTSSPSSSSSFLSSTSSSTSSSTTLGGGTTSSSSDGGDDDDEIFPIMVNVSNSLSTSFYAYTRNNKIRILIDIARLGQLLPGDAPAPFPTQVQVTPPPLFLNIPLTYNDMEVVSVIFDINFLVDMTVPYNLTGRPFVRPVDFTFNMAPQGMNKGNAKEFCLGYFKPKTRDWSCEDTNIKLETDGSVLCSTTHFTPFAFLRTSSDAQNIASDDNNNARKGRNDIIIGASVGVGGPILIIAILLAIYMMRKRRRSRHHHVRDPENVGAPESTTTNNNSNISNHNAAVNNTNDSRDSSNNNNNNNSSGDIEMNTYRYAHLGPNSREGSGSTMYDAVPSSPEKGGLRKLKYAIQYEDVKILEKLGDGSSGIVFRGEWRGISVAIKELQHVSPAKSAAFYDEAELMKTISPHPNVLQLYGVVTEPRFLIVTEFMDQGGLHAKLVDQKRQPLPLDLLKRIVMSVALGMNHLHEEGIIHRDLAARNILVNKSWDVKVADFGMSREATLEQESQQTQSTVGPLKWMSPESILNRQYSKKSDVWSFGVVVWEVFHFGRTPYSPLSAVQAAMAVARDGLRLEIENPNVPPLYAELMHSCWQVDPAARPDFKAIIATLKQEAGGGK